jgi:hypothetical protein
VLAEEVAEMKTEARDKPMKRMPVRVRGITHVFDLL